MSNELKDIVDSLCLYGAEKGWEVIEAEKKAPGLWNITIKKIEVKTEEATNDNN